MSAPPLVRVRGLARTYAVGDVRVAALEDVSLDIGEGRFVAVTGASGSGKSTLLNLIGGLDAPSSGEITVDGERIDRMSGGQLSTWRSRNVGFVFQSVNLVPFLDARENLLVVAEFGKRDKKEARARADMLLGELGLGDRKGNLPGQLSGGERQRVAIGRALMNEPALVLIDEPTSALDTKLGEQVMGLIVSEVKSRHTAAIIVTHDIRMTHFADRTMHITDGKLGATDVAELAEGGEPVAARAPIVPA